MPGPISEPELSEFETQFVPQSGDEETLWTVLAITGERGQEYRVKWAGIDPKTGKGYPQDWVPKHDCTNDIVLEWKRKQALKKKNAAKKAAKRGTNSKARLSTNSKASSSTAATSRPRTHSSDATAAPESKSTPTHAGSSKPRLSVVISPSSKSAKRKRSPDESSDDSMPEVIELSSPRKKRRRGKAVRAEEEEEPEQTQSTFEVGRPQKFGTILPRHDDTDYDEEPPPRAARVKDTEKAKKQKQKERSPDIFDPIPVEDEVDYIPSRPPIKIGPPLGKKKKSTLSREESSKNAPSSVNKTNKVKPKMKSKPIVIDSETEEEQIVEQVVHGRGRLSMRSDAKAGPSRVSNSRSLLKPKGKKVVREEEEEEEEQQSDEEINPIIPPEENTTVPPYSSKSRTSHSGRDGKRGKGAAPTAEDLAHPSLPPSPRRTSSLSPRARHRLEIFDAELAAATMDIDLPEEPPEPSNAGDYDYNKYWQDDMGPDVVDFDYAVSPNDPVAQSLPPIAVLSTAPESQSQSRSRSHSHSEHNPATVAVPTIVPASLEDSVSIVPETETQSSINSQSQRQLPPASAEAQVSVEMSGLHTQDHPSNIVEPPQSFEPASVVRSPSFISRMKPNSRSKLKYKPLRPVPNLSPSAFTPYLALASTEIDYPPSSIEQFSSPEKGSGGGKAKKIHEKRKGNSAEKIEDKDAALRMRGLELAERASRQRELEKERERTKGKRKALSELIPRESGGVPLIDLREGTRKKPQQLGEGDRGVNGNGIDIKAADKGKGKGKHVELEPLTEDDAHIADMENAYLDLSGGSGIGDGIDEEVNGGNEIHRQFEPQEEEESTQDILREQQEALAQVQAHEGSDVEIHLWSSEPVHDPIVEDHIEESGAPVVAESIRQSKSRSASVQPDVTQNNPLPTDASQDGAEAHLPEVVDPRLTESLSLLDTKSAEITRLQNLLAAQQVENDGLVKLLDASNQAVASKSDAVAELERNTAESLEKQALEKAAWESQLVQLQSSLDSMRASKVQAENTAQDIKEQYYQASAYASDTRARNRTLEQQASIAESQAKDGVRIIRGMFEERVKTLEEDLGKWKGLADLLSEKDRRTGDEIRKRAAEAPELKVINEDLQEAVNDLEFTVNELQGEIETLKWDKAVLEGEKKAWRSEVDRMQKQSKEKKGGWTNFMLGRPHNDGDSSDLDGEQDVRECQWRPENSSQWCTEVFTDIEELKKHAIKHALG